MKKEDCQDWCQKRAKEYEDELFRLTVKVVPNKEHPDFENWSERDDLICRLLTGFLKHEKRRLPR